MENKIEHDHFVLTPRLPVTRVKAVLMTQNLFGALQAIGNLDVIEKSS